MPKKCDMVFTLPQSYSTCWLNALLMTLLYSQKVRKFIASYRHLWDLKDPLMKTFANILTEHYIRKDIDARELDNILPHIIMEKLHKFDPDMFAHNDKDTGYNGSFYIMNLFKLFKIPQERVLFVDVMEGTDGKHHAFLSQYYGTFPTKKKLPNGYIDIQWNNDMYLQRVSALRSHEFNFEVLAIQMCDKKDYAYYHRHRHPLTHDAKVSKSDSTFMILGKKYSIDSLVLTNFNGKVCKKYHDIAGITCNGERYIYNGWTKNTRDMSRNDVGANNEQKEVVKQEACPLFKFDWMKENQKFCIDLKNCQMAKRKPKINAKNVCFSVKHRPLYFAVLEGTVDNFKSVGAWETTQSAKPALLTRVPVVAPKVKKCPEGKVLNPRTGRCIKDQGKTKVVGDDKKKDIETKAKVVPDAHAKVVVPDTKVAPQPKKCPEGKVLNPRTGRCIKDKAKAKVVVDDKKKDTETKAKVVPDAHAKVVVPNTKVAPKPKKCPEGKVLNPRTGRCIKDKSKK